jgi:ATP-dependent DNA helicase RecG
MRTIYDGYAIAERDLQMRGPGDFFSSGTSIRQSGDTGLGISKSCSDTSLLHSAFESAKALLDTDPELTCENHLRIKEELKKLLDEKSSTIN